MSTRKIMQQYSKKEIAASFVLPNKLSDKQKKEADLKLKQAREKVRTEMTEEQMLASKILQFKFQIEDYLTKEDFNPSFTFGHFLKAYVDLQNKKRKNFAQEIDIDETELSQLINRHRSPNDNIIIRLEIHSNNSIPAVTWYKLIQKEKEHKIRTNKLIRQQERKYVTNPLSVQIR